MLVIFYLFKHNKRTKSLRQSQGQVHGYSQDVCPDDYVLSSAMRC